MKLIYALAVTLVILWTLAFVSLARGDNYTREIDLATSEQHYFYNESCAWNKDTGKNCEHEWENGVLDNIQGTILKDKSGKIKEKKYWFPKGNPHDFKYCRKCKTYKAIYKEGTKYWKDRYEKYHLYSWYAGSVHDVPFTK